MTETITLPEVQLIPLLRDLLAKKRDKPYVFLGCREHTFGEDLHFKTESEFEAFAKYWGVEPVKPE
jgi:hypothetical protein